MATKITLRHITHELFHPCIKLSVAEDQKRFAARETDVQIYLRLDWER